MSVVVGREVRRIVREANWEQPLDLCRQGGLDKSSPECTLCPERTGDRADDVENRPRFCDYCSVVARTLLGDLNLDPDGETGEFHTTLCIALVGACMVGVNSVNGSAEPEPEGS